MQHSCSFQIKLYNTKNKIKNTNTIQRYMKLCGRVSVNQVNCNISHHLILALFNQCSAIHLLVHYLNECDELRVPRIVSLAGQSDIFVIHILRASDDNTKQYISGKGYILQRDKLHESLPDDIDGTWKVVLVLRRLFWLILEIWQGYFSLGYQYDQWNFQSSKMTNLHNFLVLNKLSFIFKSTN